MGCWVRAILVFSFLFVTTCRTPATEIIVVVDTDLGVPSELSLIVVEVTSPAGTMSLSTAALESSANLPATVGLVHEEGAIGPFLVQARGQLEGSDVVERQASVFFVPEKTLVLELNLLRSCLGQSCPEQQTCVDGSCGSITRASLPEWTGVAPRIGDGGDGDADADGDADGGDGDADADERADQ